MPPKTTLEVISERLGNHIEADEKAWAENREFLHEMRKESKEYRERMEKKIDTACEWITQQKTAINMGRYIAGVVGAAVVLIVDKIW